MNRKLKIQFHPAGAPVPLYVCVNTSLAERKPYELCAAIGNQMTQSKKSTIISTRENLKTPE